jgi:hypothetical protein
MSYVSRYAELFKQQGIPHLILEGKLFKVYSRMVMPEGPSKEDFSVSNDSIKHLFKFFNSAYIIPPFLLNSTNSLQPRIQIT